MLSNHAIVQPQSDLMPPPTKDTPRLFQITYDQSKVKVSPALRRQFLNKITLWGVVWPGTDSYPGYGVSLSNGVTFVDMTELREHFDRSGEYAIDWLEGE